MKYQCWRGPEESQSVTGQANNCPPAPAPHPTQRQISHHAIMLTAVPSSSYLHSHKQGLRVIQHGHIR